MILSSSFTETLHPMMVHFPVALILTACFLAVIYLIRTHDPQMNTCIRILVVLGAIGAWVAVLTGSFTLPVTGEAEAVKHIHHNFAQWTSLCMSASAVLYLFIWWYKKVPYWLGLLAFLFLVAGTLLVAITGYYGGYIVYNILL